jgi:hypothetical protein
LHKKLKMFYFKREYENKEPNFFFWKLSTRQIFISPRYFFKASFSCCCCSFQVMGRPPSNICLPRAINGILMSFFGIERFYLMTNISDALHKIWGFMTCKRMRNGSLGYQQLDIIVVIVSLRKFTFLFCCV